MGQKGKSLFRDEFQALKTRLDLVLDYYDLMSATLPLKDMSLMEKLRMMEELWEDLCRDSDALESPEWHATVLQERETKLVAGETHFIDWEQAKTDIRKRVS